MPINACSINAFTINGLDCRSVIPIRAKKGKKGHPYQASLNYARYIERMKRENELDDFATEGPTIKLDVELGGQMFTMSSDNNDNQIVPLIFISGVDLEKDIDISVNVDDLSIVRNRKSGSVEESINRLSIKSAKDNKKNV